MNYEFEIYGKNAEKRWITILSNDEHDCDTPDAYISFMERVNGASDEPGMTYNWDPVFCISVTYPENVTEDEAMSFLRRYVAA